MKIVVGLGNPGKRYAETPHNVGFDVVDELARRWGLAFRGAARFGADVATGCYGGDPLLLVKPTTYMNLSGEAVAAVARYRRAVPADVVVVLDDADLELGRLRIRGRGGSGGHRGLQSVIERLGSEGIARVRVGIGRGRGEADLVDHVLRPLTVAEREVLGPAIGRAADAVACLLDRGVDAAMNAFNGPPPGVAGERAAANDGK